MKTQQIIIVVLIAIIAVGAGFFGGMQYQKSQKVQIAFGQGARQFGTNGQGGQNQFFRRSMRDGMGVTGEIISTDEKSVTVKMPDGSSKIVILSDSTEINKQASGSRSDLKTGERIAVFGSTNSDGSVTAQNIQLNPMMRIIGASGTPVPTK